MIRHERSRQVRKLPAVADAPKLAMQVIPKFRVGYTDFEKFVQSIFGFEFDFLFASGLTAKSGADYVVNGDLPTVSWQQKATELRQGRRSKNVPLILTVLAHDGYIPRGYYTIVT